MSVAAGIMRVIMPIMWLSAGHPPGRLDGDVTRQRAPAIQYPVSRTTIYPAPGLRPGQWRV